MSFYEFSKSRCGDKMIVENEISYIGRKTYLYCIIPLYVKAPENHYTDGTMSPMASQITSLGIVYSTVYSGADHRKQFPAKGQ